MADNDRGDGAMTDVGSPASISDPYGVLDDSTFPRTYKEYRFNAPFLVFAHSEEQARERWQFFEDVLSQLAANEWHAHELVTFVAPESLTDPRVKPTVELVEEHRVDHPEKLHGSMASGILPQWAWLNPEHDAGWDPEKLAYRILHGQLSPEEEAELNEDR